jgi:di/tricarboxylate transporter
MATPEWLMVAIFIATLIGLIKYQHVPERIFSVAMLVCLGFSFISYEDILANAVNSGLVTLLLLVLCSFAFERTSVLRRLSAAMISGSPFYSTVKTLVGTAFSSALMSNTAVVASLISTIKNNKVINPGKLLIPLSFAAILGGTLTLVGTSTNLIVNSMLIEQGHVGLKFFDFTLIGVCAMVVCLAVIIIRIRSLPDMELETLSTQEYLLEAEVGIESKLVGKTIEENGLRNLDSLFLVELVREGRLVSPVSPDDVVQAKDKLIFTGDISKVLTLQQFDGLTLFAEQDGLLRDNLTEVLIKPDSAVVGKTLKSAGFRARFDAAVVAIRREGSTLSGKLGEITLQSGDFLILAVGNDFSSRTNLSKNFYILSGHKPENMLSGWRDSTTVLGFVAAIAISALTPLSLITCLIFYIAVLIFCDCLTVNEIKRRFPLEIWMVVLGALSLAKAIDNSGLAQVISSAIEYVLQGQSHYVALILIFIVTLLLTEVITNTAAAALVFPIAYSMSIGLEASPLPYVMAVAFAASGSFMSPYGYQTNIMVYNAGHYTLSDFVKFGLPVSIIYSTITLIMIPIVFPF